MARRTATNSLNQPTGPITVTLPHLWSPRSYQRPAVMAMPANAAMTPLRTRKRIVKVWHRRAGKDHNDLAMLTREMGQRLGYYAYIFPQLNQAKPIIWDGKDFKGVPFLGRFPDALILEKNESELQIVLKPLPGQVGYGVPGARGSIFQLRGADEPDRLRGPNYVGVVFSEYAQTNPMVWNEIVQPVLEENGGWAMFNFTPKGRNHAFDLYKMAQANPAKWFSQLLTIADTKRDAPGEDGSPVVTEEQIEDLRKQGVAEEIIQQEYYCLGLGTRVLTSDLRWTAIESLLSDPADLIGMDEHAANGRRKFRTCKILRSWKTVKPCLEIALEGQIVVASSLEHPWLVKRPWRDKQNPRYVWVETQHLRVGDTIAHCGLEPWSLDDSREGGYLAGLFDGEGCLSRTSVSFGQLPGSVLDTGLNLLRAKRGATRNVGCSLHDSMRLLGSIRPVRLLEKAATIWEGKFPLSGVTHRRIVSLREMGPQPVIGLSTDTKTFIAEGLVTHNCSFEGFLRGTIFGDLVIQARKDHRIGGVPWNSNLPVGTCWDIGRYDHTAIWFYQRRGDSICFIDYYEDRLKGADFYAKMIREKPYHVTKCILPFDAKVKGFTATQSTEEFLSRALRGVTVADKISVQAQIDIARRMFSRGCFDEVKCAKGVEHLENYRRKFDDKLQDYSGDPIHDEHSHGSSAFMTGCQGGIEYPLDFRERVPPVMESSFNVFENASVN